MAKSSKQWLRRHVTDPYVRQAKARGYRSRAAFKLLELDDKDKFLRPGAVVVDLGAAPGSWSQLAAQRVRPGGKVIAVDLLDIAPLSGVTVLKGDFRKLGLVQALGGQEADVVLSDLSPNLSGIANVDQARAAELSFAAIDFCKKALKSDGVFVLKAFHGEAFGEVMQRLRQEFVSVSVRKPGASRGDSRETYLVLRNPRKIDHSGRSLKTGASA
ncbi:MAG TPA: RlmE family RNA methyltransferase [Burkholderiales bacterium]|jgi:23S rRNA (uridine2552-2'-O)-methyltransferase|nr:RlmE family RNA methyltransferase [Burkholderiales bacterium]